MQCRCLKVAASLSHQLQRGHSIDGVALAQAPQNFVPALPLAKWGRILVVTFYASRVQWLLPLIAMLVLVHLLPQRSASSACRKLGASEPVVRMKAHEKGRIADK